VENVKAEQEHLCICQSILVKNISEKCKVFYLNSSQKHITDRNQLVAAAVDSCCKTNSKTGT
jgi:hypothetical protein